jgi:ADP-ribose pyrophosphatase YjhB (NUDIX family)
MISFDTGSVRFNLRAVAIVVHGDDVLVHRLDGDTFWSLPGGRVEPGERAEDAVVREMREELGAAVQVEKTVCIVENFFSYQAKKHHEIGFYFLTTLDAESPVLDASIEHYGFEQDRRITFKWFSRARLADIDVRPSFLCHLLAGDFDGLHHIVHHDA